MVHLESANAGEGHIVRARLIAICTTVLLAAPGCALLVGKHHPVNECTPQDVSSSVALEKAPVWVPGSPMRKNMPENGCIGGDGSHHLDRLCVVGKVEGMVSIAQSDSTAGERSLRLLGEALNARLEQVLGSSAPPDGVKTFSTQLRDAIGRVTGTWRSPTCTTYAIAEMKLADFTFVVQGPELSNEARTLLLDDPNKIIGTP
jgi:hypothetical protein